MALEPQQEEQQPLHVLTKTIARQKNNNWNNMGIQAQFVYSNAGLDYTVQMHQNWSITVTLGLSRFFLNFSC